MFGAGLETTSTMLEWAMSELLRHPHVTKKEKNIQTIAAVAAPPSVTVNVAGKARERRKLRKAISHTPILSTALYFLKRKTVCWH